MPTLIQADAARLPLADGVRGVAGDVVSGGG